MISTLFGTRVEIAPSIYEPGGSWIAGTGASTRYRPALEDAQAMVLPEGAVVAISRGLRFIGQRLESKAVSAADVGSFNHVGNGIRGAFRFGARDIERHWQRAIQRGKKRATWPSRYG